MLIASAPSRIVSVSSITHRYGNVRPAARFLSQPEHGTYADTKLAQVLFTYEAQRRLGPLGVQVTDPCFLPSSNSFATCPGSADCSRRCNEQDRRHAVFVQCMLAQTAATLEPQFHLGLTM